MHFPEVVLFRSEDFQVGVFVFALSCPVVRYKHSSSCPRCAALQLYMIGVAPQGQSIYLLTLPQNVVLSVHYARVSENTPASTSGSGSETFGTSKETT